MSVKEFRYSVLENSGIIKRVSSDLNDLALLSIEKVLVNKYK